jgi:GT2 family glycosyltransferase
VPEPPELSIIIVNWNTRDLLRDCLNSVYAETKETSFEVLVMDNASSDGSAEMVTREFPQVRLIENEENLGFARANNQAIRQCRGDYILLLNPDTVVLSGALDKMVAFMRAHPDIAASGPMILNADGSPQPSAFRNFHPAGSCTDFLLKEAVATYPLRLLISKLGKRETYNSPHPQQVAWVCGACMMMARAAVDRVGLLDEQYFLYAEEADWFYRLKRVGGKAYFIPEARIIHYQGRSLKQTDAPLKYFYQSKYVFIKEHHTKVQAYLFRIMFAIDCFAAICGLWVLQAVVRGDKRKETNRKLRNRWPVFLWAIGRDRRSP